MYTVFFQIFPYAQKGNPAGLPFRFYAAWRYLHVYVYLFKELMLFVLEQVGQMMVEPAYIAGTGPDTVHKEQCPLRIILSRKCPVHGFHRLLRYAAAV